MSEMLKHVIPFQEEGEEDAFILSEDVKDIGLVLVDPVNGFCTVGAGNLVCDYYNTSFIPLFLFFFIFLICFGAGLLVCFGFETVCHFVFKKKKS